MLRIIFFFLNSIILISLLISNLYAEELSIIPLKKPILDKETLEQNLSQGILKPKPKPDEKLEKQKLSQKIIKPKSKPDKVDKTKIVNEPKAKKIKTKIVKKMIKKSIF